MFGVMKVSVAAANATLCFNNRASYFWLECPWRIRTPNLILIHLCVNSGRPSICFDFKNSNFASFSVVACAGMLESHWPSSELRHCYFRDIRLLSNFKLETEISPQKSPLFPCTSSKKVFFRDVCLLENWDGASNYNLPWSAKSEQPIRLKSCDGILRCSDFF